MTPHFPCINHPDREAFVKCDEQCLCLSCYQWLTVKDKQRAAHVFPPQPTPQDPRQAKRDHIYREYRWREAENKPGEP